MFLNTEVPGVCAGPMPNNSHIPVLSSSASTWGCSKIAFTSEAKIKLSSEIV